MIEGYFFEIPIYRVSEDEYNNAMNSYVSQRIQEIQTASENLRMLEDHLWKKFGGPWRYNGVIGFLRLYVFGTQIRGETWFVDAKRISHRIRCKFFIHHGKAFEVDVLPDDTNHQILEKVQTGIQRSIEYQPINGRYLDLSSFDTIAPHIDWRALMLKQQ